MMWDYFCNVPLIRHKVLFSTNNAKLGLGVTKVFTYSFLNCLHPVKNCCVMSVFGYNIFYKNLPC